MLEKPSLSIGLLTALVSPELVSAQAVLSRNGWTEEDFPPPEQLSAGISRLSKDGLSLYVGTIGEAGQAPSAIETLIFMERCPQPPSIVFLCGIAGSLDSQKYHKKDVVVSSNIFWKTPDKVTDGIPFLEFRNKNFPVPPIPVDVRNELAKCTARLFPRDNEGMDFAVRHGDIFTGNYVISSSTMVKKIKSDFPTAQCVEMEAGGFVSAVRRHAEAQGRKVLGVVVRGISDFADNKDKVNADRIAASENAAEVAIKLAVDFFNPQSLVVKALNGKST